MLRIRINKYPRLIHKAGKISLWIEWDKTYTVKAPNIILPKLTSELAKFAFNEFVNARYSNAAENDLCR